MYNVLVNLGYYNKLVIIVYKCFGSKFGVKYLINNKYHIIYC